MSLTDEVQDQYVRIIDGILAVSDLNTISKSRIQRGIQEAVNYDITPHKAAIKELIFERFDEFHARQEESPAAVDAASDAASDAAGDAAGEATVEPKTEPSPDPPTNGHAVSSSSSSSPVKRQSGSDGISEIVEEPSKKKRKEENLDADAEMAARLQAEENARVRSTRGARTRKSAPAKKRAIKKKTSRKVKGSDDSDIESSDVTDKPERNTGFHKPLLLSPPLSALLDGEIQMSRPQAVKRLWAHIKANDLQDPKDKRQIICDERMRAVFKQDKVHMFTMTKLLSENLYAPDE